MHSLVTLLVLIGLTGVVESFPDGAPKFQCADAFPRHGFDAQPISDVLPYEITASREVYSPEQEIDIKIEGKTIDGVKQKFRGFHIRVARVGYDYEQAVGYFKLYPESVRGQNWYQQPEYPKDTINCVTHRDSRERDEVTVTWKAPKEKLGDIDIKVTIVKNFEVFWVDQTIRIESNPIAIPTDLRYEIDDTLHVPNFDTCGEDRGCLLYPRGCNGLGCRVAVSWRPDPNSRLWVLFDVMAETDGYVSVGLSEDKKMGNDATVTCMEKDGVFDIQYGFNTPDQDNDRHRTTDLTDIHLARVGDKLFCRYRRRQADTFYYEDLETAARSSYSHRFDMSTPQHVLVAKGTVRVADSDCRDGPVTWRFINKKKATGSVRHSASNTEQKCRQRCFDLGPAGCYGFDWRNSGKQCWINTKPTNYNNIKNDNIFKMYIRHNDLCGKRSMTIDKHEQHPLMSDSATLIQEETKILTASSLAMTIKIHAALGLLAWLTMAALSIVLARHYRFVLSCLCCDRGCWFLTHATSMILVVFLTVAAVIIQVALLGRWTEHGTAHAVLGLVLTVFVIVQTVVGFCRPDPDSDNRSIFNWVHRISGFILFILAAVTVLLGVNVSSLDDGFRSTQTVVVAVWLAFIVLWEILLEILSCCAKSSGTMGDESDQKYRDKSEKASQISGSDEDESGGRHMTSVLFGFALIIYVVVTLSFFIWSLLNLYRFY